MQPNIGSGGVVQWGLEVTGKTAHSGFPHSGVNAIELAFDALRYVQTRFAETFPTPPQAKEYNFPCGSSIKATNVVVPSGSLNQIKGRCVVEGDLRLLPFYDIKEAMDKLQSFVAELNDGAFEQLEAANGVSYSLRTKASDGDDEKAGELIARVELKFKGHGMDGVACKLDSPGFLALKRACEKVLGECKPLADTGSLPLVGALQRGGVDIQTIGFGMEDYYHAPNEQARLSDFAKGYRILCEVIADVSAAAASVKK